jgi:ADP-heptose:LPS heptosyltransferase
MFNKLKKKYAFTIVSFNYLSLARILGESFKKHNPDIEFVILIVDKVKEGTDLSKEKFKIVTIDELDIQNKAEFIFKYNITEVNTAVKPYFIRYYLMEKMGAEKIMYIDPDIYFYGPVTKILAGLEKGDLVFTPHILSPIPDDGKTPNEISIMQVGCFNLGFLALNTTEETKKFIEWWWERLYKYSISAPEKGLFTDQKWMDYAPSLVNNVHVLRDFGHNAAYWNLHERKDFSFQDGKYFVNGTPLVFFHYSGYLIDNQNQISKFQNRFTLSQFNETLTDLFKKYGEELVSHDFFATKKIPYAYAYFDNGIQIPDVIRRIYYSIDNKKRFGNPFETKQKGSFYEWLKSPVKNGTRVTNLMYEIYKTRTDVQANIQDPLANENGTINWAFSSFMVDYNIDKRLLGDEQATSGGSVLKIKSVIYRYATKIEKKYLVDSFGPFRFIKKIIGKRIFRFVKKRFYKYKLRLLKKDYNSIPVAYFTLLKRKFEDASYEKSLVLFRPHGVGDLIMALPAFKKFREKNIGKKIILYVYEESFELMKSFDFFDEVISLPRTFQYDKNMDIIPYPKNATLINLMIELENKNGHNNLDNDANRIYRNITISKKLGVSDAFEMVNIPINEEAKSFAEDFIKENRINKNKLVVVTFEASNEARSWYPAFYGEFLEYIISLGYQVILVGNKERNEKLFPDNANIFNLIGKTNSLTEVIEVTRPAKYVVSVDTYLSHIAGMLDIPQLAIFTGGVDPKSRVSFYKKKVVAISKHTCFCWDMPCKYAELRGKNELCRIDLKPEMVKNAFNKLVQGKYE